MTGQTDLFTDVEDESMALLSGMLDAAETVLVKKLSNNDRDWAVFKNKHQGGVYIPEEQRDSGFFPPLSVKVRSEEDAAEIREVYFTTEWPQVEEAGKKTRLVNYTSKGAETHMTGVPKAAFAGLSPASYLVMESVGEPANPVYRCLTIDSASDAAVMLIDALELEADFHVGFRHPAQHRKTERERILTFAEQVVVAYLAGEIARFAIEQTAMPETLALAKMAREAYFAQHSLERLNPFELQAPGDALREISRSIEWDLFRDFQRKERAVALVRIVLGDAPAAFDISRVIHSLVDMLPDIDRLMLSASQQRKSRAGQSFEHHIESMLSDGGVPFKKQVVIEAKKRPDFVLPSLTWLKAPPAGQSNGLILSAKTTLRERWKQVEREMQGCELFLATVDENIAANAIEEMNSMGIRLVVPEALKVSKDTEYDRHGNVVSFRDFFTQELAQRIPSWNS
jgi:hypothetical protein